MKKIFWPLVLGLVWVGGCGEDDPLADAWKKFRDGNYAEAHAAFSDLVGSEGSGALVGLGWTTIRMDSMEAARGYFERSAVDSVVAGYAGWGLVLWVLEDYQGCVEKAEFVFRREGENFVFQEDRSVTYKDVLWHQASSWYHLGNLAGCVTKIKQIDPSWTEPDLNDPNLEQILLAKLEELFNILAPTT